MRTTRKQFPVNLLTSGRLAFTIERAKVRRSQQMKKWRPKWKDFELIATSTKNLPWKLVKTATQTGPLQTIEEIPLLLLLLLY